MHRQGKKAFMNSLLFSGATRHSRLFALLTVYNFTNVEKKKTRMGRILKILID